jgi:hypothetical protein
MDFNLTKVESIPLNFGSFVRPVAFSHER